MTYTLSDFDFELPNHLIAQEPAHPRDHARLLVYDRKHKSITDTYFYELGRYLPQNTRLVVNNSKVEKARMVFENKEIFVVQAVNPTVVEAMVHPGKKFKLGTTVQLTSEISAKVLSISDDGLRRLEFNRSVEDPLFDDHKLTPFPPYIQQNEALADEYQTVYAKPLGSKAAPTAGLHFTPELLASLERQGIFRTEVTLHVGLGTFAPVKTENIAEHSMHEEWFTLNAQAAAELSKAPHLTAVGTTSVRVLESAVESERVFSASEGETDIFITPGYRYQAVDALITNFHLPKSTLLMLVSAFIGFDEMHRIYAHAIEKEYRFFSFGDAMLLL